MHIRCIIPIAPVTGCRHTGPPIGISITGFAAIHHYPVQVCKSPVLYLSLQVLSTISNTQYKLATCPSNVPPSYLQLSSCHLALLPAPSVWPYIWIKCKFIIHFPGDMTISWVDQHYCLFQLSNTYYLVFQVSWDGKCSIIKFDSTVM